MTHAPQSPPYKPRSPPRKLESPSWKRKSTNLTHHTPKLTPPSDLQTTTTLLTTSTTLLTTTLTQLRDYISTQNSHLLDVHRHYCAQLTSAREELVEAQIVHQRWQEGLGRLSKNVREAWRGREEEMSGMTGKERKKGEGEGGKKVDGSGDPVLSWRGKVRGLREENRVLRRMVGWEEAERDSDDEEENAVEGDQRVVERVGHGAESGVGVGVGVGV
jgi:hypothetical protein